MSSEKSAVTTTQKTSAERFTDMVVREFSTNAGGIIALTNFQKRLVQSYFIACDQALKMAEEKRQRKDERFRDATPVTWSNVNMTDLAVQVVSCARIGYDPSLPNHIAIIPYKNQAGKYDLTFMEEYRGKEIRARKYGLDIPDDVIIELVFKNDKFKVFKKDKNNAVESYELIIEDPFDRGEIVGGFYYHSWNNNPEKNRIVVYTREQIEKRRPDKASAEFWGGEKDKYENGKKVGKEKVEGWYLEMCYKTIYRAAYQSITIDSQKIDDAFIRLSEAENSINQDLVLQRSTEDISKNQAVETIEIQAHVVDDLPPAKETDRIPDEPGPGAGAVEETKESLQNNEDPGY